MTGLGGLRSPDGQARASADAAPARTDADLGHEHTARLRGEVLQRAAGRPPLGAEYALGGALDDEQSLAPGDQCSGEQANAEQDRARSSQRGDRCERSTGFEIGQPAADAVTRR